MLPDSSQPAGEVPPPLPSLAHLRTHGSLRRTGSAVFGIPIQMEASPTYAQGYTASTQASPLIPYHRSGSAVFSTLEQPQAPTQLIAAIDQGSQSTRVFLFNKQMNPVASASRKLPQQFPQAGWCEHDPLAIWQSVEECVVQAVQEAGEKLGSIEVMAVGLANQRETTVVWHKHSGMPLFNAIVWMDTRTREICDQMEAELGSKDYFRPTTGLPISTYFSAFKFKWLYENNEDVRHAVDTGVACFGTIDSWLVYQLTGGAENGVHVTDVSNASRTMLMDLATCQWHKPYLEMFHMTEDALPRIVSNSEIYGFVASGILAGVPVSGCLGDQTAAMLGQRCTEGESKNTYGSGCFMILNTGPKPMLSTHGLLTTVSYKLGREEPTQFALEGAVGVAGMGISWLRDGLCIADGPEHVGELAGSVPDCGGVYFVPAFTGLLAPRWEANARGAIVGLTGFSNRAHIARAMLESICFQTRDVLEAMRKDADGLELKVLRVDGGASCNDLLMQLQADILQVPVLRPQFQETTVLGAALAAGLAIGFWTQDLVFSGHAYNNVKFNPAVTPQASDKVYGKWQKAVERSLDLADLAGPPPK